MMKLSDKDIENILLDTFKSYTSSESDYGFWITVTFKYNYYLKIIDFVLKRKNIFDIKQYKHVSVKSHALSKDNKTGWITFRIVGIKKNWKDWFINE